MEKNLGLGALKVFLTQFAFACQAGHDYLTVVSNKKGCSFGDKVVPGTFNRLYYVLSLIFMPRTLLYGVQLGVCLLGRGGVTVA